MLLQEGTDQSSDFYSYRYFASEGFLPGYNFPRLPLSAFLQYGRRGAKEEYLQRPRFLAIAEFGPQNTLYHEGSRFRVHRVLAAPETPAATTPLVAAIRCGACGYYHQLGDDPPPDVCEHCGTALPPPRRNMFPMRNVVARRRDRITSNEEERQRFGYDLRTAFRFATRGGRISARTAEVASDGPVATLTFGQSATLWRINYGWRSRKPDQPDGFTLDFASGRWVEALEDGADGEERSPTSLSERVVPFVEDRKNALVLAPAEVLDTAQMASLQAALKAAIQVEFQLEDRELGAEPLPHPSDRRMLLFYDASEGGAGVLRRLADEPDAWQRVLGRALEVCHFDRTGQDLGLPPGRRDPCEAACYDCLLSYFNQLDHGLVDRRLIVDLLVRWSRASVRTSPTTDPRAEHRERLLRLTQSDLERRFVELVDRLGLQLPTDGQVLLDLGTGTKVKPDFIYRDAGLAVFIDGPHHDTPSQREVDRTQADGLADLGWQVIRFHHAADWVALLGSMPSVFGALGAPPPGGRERDATPTALDLGLFDESWHPLLAALVARGVDVQPGGDVPGPTGRVVGFVEAVASRGGVRVALVGAPEPGSKDALEAALQASGQALLALDPMDTAAPEHVVSALAGVREP